LNVGVNHTSHTSHFFYYSSSPLLALPATSLIEKHFSNKVKLGHQCSYKGLNEKIFLTGELGALIFDTESFRMISENLSTDASAYNFSVYQEER